MDDRYVQTLERDCINTLENIEDKNSVTNYKKQLQKIFKQIVDARILINKVFGKSIYVDMNEIPKKDAS